ncbi:MAG: adenine phosphoribosyltransferase [Ureaplasma sp.]|nr:adenine phosphoribosyltransferase [Ureaplasma sp.]
MLVNEIKEKIVNVKDFPKKGINFKDITPLFSNPKLVNKTIKQMKKIAKEFHYDVIVSPEMRGYLFGIPLSLKVNKPFIFIRKKGKLPRKTISINYDLEYNSTSLEIHKDAIKPGQKVLIVDDLLATGGTTNAIVELVKKCGAEVIGNLVLIELIDLNGKEKINVPVKSLVQY